MPLVLSASGASVSKDAAHNAIINPSGGLKAKGHPIGATGVGQVVELVKFLRNNPAVRYGLAQNMGGIGTTVSVHILESEKI